MGELSHCYLLQHTGFTDCDLVSGAEASLDEGEDVGHGFGVLGEPYLAFGEVAGEDLEEAVEVVVAFVHYGLEVLEVAELAVLEDVS